MNAEQQWLFGKLLEQQHLTAPLETEGDNYYPEYARSYFSFDPDRVIPLYERRLEKIERFFTRLAGEAEQQEELRAAAAGLVTMLADKKEEFVHRPDADCEEFGDWLRQVFFSA